MSHAYEGNVWRNTRTKFVVTEFIVHYCVCFHTVFNWLQWLGFVGKWTLFTWELGPFSSFPFVRSVVVFIWIGVCIIHLTKPAGKEAWKDRSLRVWGLFLLQYLSSPHDCGLKTIQKCYIITLNTDMWAPLLPYYKQVHILMEAGRDVLTCSNSKNSCSSVFIYYLSRLFRWGFPANIL